MSEASTRLNPFILRGAEALIAMKIRGISALEGCSELSDSQNSPEQVYPFDPGSNDFFALTPTLNLFPSLQPGSRKPAKSDRNLSLSKTPPP